jgi:hypothetical protein
MWFYVVMRLGLGLTHDSAAIFPDKQGCEAAATRWIIDACVTGGPDYAYICHFDPGAEKDYQPRRLSE